MGVISITCLTSFNFILKIIIIIKTFNIKKHKSKGVILTLSVEQTVIFIRLEVIVRLKSYLN